jgi:precorrin-3B methylase
VTGETLVVYAPNRYQQRRANDAIGRAYAGRIVSVVRSGKVQP